MFQFYFHKDRALNDAMVARAKDAKFDVLALTVDSSRAGIGNVISAPVLPLRPGGPTARHPGAVRGARFPIRARPAGARGPA